MSLEKERKKVPNCQYMKPSIGPPFAIIPAGFLNLLLCSENTNLLCFRNIEVSKRVKRWDDGVKGTFLVHFLDWSACTYLRVDVL